jgi:hypothetical protein
MTLLAASAQFPSVSIILLVTGHASSRELVPIEITGMARIALDPRVPASQWILRRLVMIEMSRLPLVLIVTGLALGAVSSGVNILNLVAIHAQGADALVAFANVARRAGDSTVCALERKPGRVVIERLDLTPCDFAVAIVAFVAKAPLVGIFRLVTVKAASGRVTEFYCWCVAPGARHRLVGIPELKIREEMIEGLAVQLDNVGVASLVIGMTMGAFGFCCIRLTSVKPLAGRTIRRNFLMAGKAEPHLGFSREWLVAVAALLLKLGMSLDNRPRHDKLLE